MVSNLNGQMRTFERVTDDKRRQSFYFPKEMVREIEDEAVRLERPISWVVIRAWVLARDKIMKLSGPLKS